MLHAHRKNVNLLAMLAFPSESGRTQVDLVPEHPDQLIKAARKLGLSLSEPKAVFRVTLGNCLESQIGTR